MGIIENNVFQLKFHSSEETPDPHLHYEDFIIVNQCDGYKVVKALFLDDVFSHFYDFDRDYDTKDYTDWAVLPSSSNFFKEKSEW